MARLFLVAGAVLGFLSVALGAFGAHGLKARVSPDFLAIWATAAEYQMYHALALLFVGWVATTRTSGALQGAGFAFLAGTLIFSGSLYLLVLTQTRALGAITPVGGLSLMAGWGLLAFALATAS